MRNRHRPLTPDAIAAILIGLAPLLYFLPATLGYLVLAADDAVVFGMPLRVATAQMIRDGHLPLWNPYIFCGMPLFASAQGGTLFPLNWGFLLGNPNLAMNVSVLGTYAGAGVGAFLYARRSGANLTGAIVTALVWQLCGACIGQITHTNILQVYAVLPWILWSIDGYLLQPTPRRAALISLFVAIQIFAGHQQTLAYSLILAGVYALVQATAQDQPPWRARLLSIAFLAGGVLLGAIQLLPTAELLQASLRAEATYDFFSSFSLPPVFLLTWFAPYVLGGADGRLFRAPYIGESFYAEYTGYVGVATLILAFIAIIVCRDRGTRFWMCVAVVSLALAIGRFLPFDAYRLVYHIPVLNLFRVSARHLMEVDFALAVLAGRAVTLLPQVARSRRILVTIAVAAAVAFLTWAAVTWLRPDAFRLGRVAPVSVLRAPELFMPLAVAAVSCWALLRFAQARRFSAPVLIAVIWCDLALWGQFSGWRTGSLRTEQDLFKTPEFVVNLRREAQASGPLRIMTLDRSLADALANRPATPGIDINAQPDAYMVHRIENAAGYDGFGLKRYSELAGDMKVWGEFLDVPRSLLVSRELDLLNVRYLVAAADVAGAPHLLPAKTKLGEFMFYEHDLGVPILKRGERLDFITPPIPATRVALATNLSWSSEIPDGSAAARLTLRTDDERTFSFDVRVGIDTAEWAYDRPSTRSSIRHSRAPPGVSAPVEIGGELFDSHNFVTSFVLPEKVTITGGSIEALAVPEAEKLGVAVQRASLIDEAENQTVPLRAEWVRSASGEVKRNDRWKRADRTDKLVIYKNDRALPRAWLTTNAVALPDEEKLTVIRSGRLPDGQPWEPERTVLMDALPSTTLTGAERQQATIVKYEPNDVNIAAQTSATAILVLADNHYPGWQVEVDEKRAPLLRVNYNLRGVQLEPGEHRVRFSYVPTSVIIGALLSAVTAVALGFWCWRAR